MARIFRAMATLLLVPLVLQPGLAQTADYPAKQIRLIVPYAAGGATDITSRTIAPRMSESMGQTIIVDNRPGGNAVTGTNLVAKAPADGYTLLMATIAFGANPGLYSKLPYDVLKDFLPVSLVAIVPTILVVHPSVPARSIRELVALAKSKPGSLNFGSAGIGTVNHLAGEMLKSLTKTEMTHVAYKGGSLVVSACIGGEISMVFGTTPTSVEFIKSGKLVPLAISGPKRLDVLPKVPTVAESVPGFDVVEWQGLVVPAGTPREVIAALHRETVKALGDAAVRERIVATGADVVGGTAQEFEAHIRAEVAKWTRLTRESGIRAD